MTHRSRPLASRSTKSSGASARLASLVLVGTVALGAAGCKGRARSSANSHQQPKTGPAIGVIDLTEGVPEVPPEGMLGLSPKKHTFDESLRAIEKARKDSNVKGLLVRFGSIQLGLARASELGEALAQARGDKPVNCHAEGYTNSTYMAAVKGCSKIFIAPAGEVEAVGLAAQMLYMHKLLVDELKLSVDILQVGKYKGAEEPLTRDGPSPEARASLEGVLTDTREVWLDTFRQSPRPAILEAVEQGPHTAFKAKERSLVDDVLYFDEVRERERTELGAVRDDIRFGPGTHAQGDGDVGEIFRVLAGDQASAPVALIRAAGSIKMAAEGGLFGEGGGITEKDLGHHLSRVEKDDRIKALVLRIDSPGGSALASDLLWHQLMRIRAKKPVVVSVGEMAASGGYYLASTGNVIVADPTSIVGSIGVVGGKIGFGDALERFGVHAETFPAKKGDAEAAVRAAYLSPFVTWDDKTRARVHESMEGVYDLFLRRLSEGRNMPVDKITPSAEGQIFTGREGKKRGLVDELGGLSFALAKARELAKLPDDAKIVILENRPGFLEFLGAGDDDADTSAQAPLDKVAAQRIVGAMAPLSPEIREYLGTLAPLAGNERAVLAAPFAFWVR